MGVHEGRGSMRRWDVADMVGIGRKLFAKIHQQKHHANHHAYPESVCSNKII